MAQINISIIDSVGGTKTMVEVPDDVPMNQLIPELVSALNLPVRQGGNLISYRMDNNTTGQRMGERATLADSGVESGAIFSLSPEVTAGGCLS